MKKIILATDFSRNAKNAIQMLAMIAGKHTFFDRLFHKSIIKEMTKLSRLPYLVLQE